MTDDTPKRIAPEEWERWRSWKERDGSSFNSQAGIVFADARALIAKLVAAVEERDKWESWARLRRAALHLEVEERDRMLRLMWLDDEVGAERPDSPAEPYETWLADLRARATRDREEAERE